MFKKFGTLALTAAIALLGLNAPAAQAADPNDTVPNGVANKSISFTLGLTGTFNVTDGITSANINKRWQLNSTDIQAAAGKSISLKYTLTQPNGTTVPVTGMSQGAPTGLQASDSPNFSLNGPTANLNSNWGDTSLAVPASVTGYTNGYIYSNINISNIANNNSAALPTGTWTYSIQATMNNVVQAESNTYGGSYYVDNSPSGSNQVTLYAYGADSAVAPTGATSVQVSGTVCVDSSKIATNDVLTVKRVINGTAVALGNPYFSYRAAPMGTMRPNSSATVLANDTTYGIYSSGGGSAQATAGTTYTYGFQVINQTGTNVSGSCAPAAPAKPTMTFVNGSFSVSFNVPLGADNYENDCYLYDTNDLSTPVLQQTMVYVQQGQPGSCTFGAGTIVNHSYVVKVRDGWNQLKSDWSPASDAVTKPVLGYTFTSPISGVTNLGNKLSRVTNSIAQSDSATQVATTSDGANGLLLTEVTQDSSFGVASTTAFSVRHITKSGVDSTFAGSGSASATMPLNSYYAAPRTGWYGASHDKWTVVTPGFDGMANARVLNIQQGSFASATATSLSVNASVLDAACVSAVGAGYGSYNPMGMGMTPSVPSVTPVSANTANQLFMVQCGKMVTANMMSMYLNLPVLMTITDANTATVVKSLVTTSNTVNTGSVYTSANPNAGANDASLTIVVVQRLQTSMSSTTDSRVIMTMKPDMTFATATGTYSVSGSEPGVSLEQLNDGTVWGLLTTSNPTTQQLLKISSGGSTVSTTPVTLDSNTTLGTGSVTLPVGMQSGTSSALTVFRSSATGAARASLDVATGSVTTSGELAAFTYVPGPTVTSVSFINSSNNNLYWLLADVASIGKYSLFKWLDPNFHLTAQTITLGNSNPTTLRAGGTATVSATASSQLAVSYSSADSSKCTVNASTGVVTAVANTGDCVIYVDQSGGDNSVYDSAPQVSITLSIVVVKSSQTIAWGNNIPTSMAVNGTVNVSATATSGLAVTYGTSDAAVCTVNASGVVTAGANAGSCVVTANQAGNDSFSAAAQVTKTITVNAAAQVKSAPAVPAVATKLKKGATLKIALSAIGATSTKGANANGLATTVTLAATAKGVCSLTAMKTSGKITSYTVKGLAVNATKCAVTINITGNNLFNSLVKKIVINITK